MVIVVRTIAAFLALGLLAVGISTAHAQGSFAQIVVTTRVVSGTTLPSSPITVTVQAAGPSLSGTPGASGMLTFGSPFTNNSQIVTLIPSQYSITASNNAGYVYAYSSGCYGTAYSGDVKNCTITAYQGGLANLTVYTYVINNNGGTRVPADFYMQVSGTNAIPNSFQGSSSGITVNLDTGSYAVDSASYSGYTKSLSNDCAGTLTPGQSRVCTVTFDDQGSILGTYSNTLVCSPSRQSARLGDTVTFFADGGTGSYNWTTTDRTYINVGRTLNVVLQTLGTQTVVVTSGSQTAYCIVDANFTSAPTITTGTIGGGTTSVIVTNPNGGYVLGTQAPGLPNTGFGPNPLAFALLLALSLGGVFVIFPYVRGTLASIWS